VIFGMTEYGGGESIKNILFQLLIIIFYAFKVIKDSKDGLSKLTKHLITSDGGLMPKPRMTEKAIGGDYPTPTSTHSNCTKKS
jgi:hypothetical protein